MSLQLTTTFLFGAMISFVTAGFIYYALHRLRTSGSKPAAVWDLSIYILFVVGIFFLSGAALEKIVPDYHRHLVDTKYLMISPESAPATADSVAHEKLALQERKVDGLGAGELLTLLGILTGIPVAFAGSIYAILLARRADHTAMEQLEGDFEGRLEEMTSKITSNFTYFADRLLEVNTTAGSMFERAYLLINPLVYSKSSGLSLQKCVDIIEQEELPRLKLAIKELRDCVADIQSHLLSTEVLRQSLEDNRLTLAASFFTHKDNYRQPKKPWAWLSYCEVGSNSLVNSLELLRVQVSRLNGIDVLAGILEGAMSNAADTALDHLDISDECIDFNELFDSSWLQRGTRFKDEVYWFRSLGRILCTRTLKRNSKAEPRRTINIGAVILEDLYRLIPARNHITSTVESKGVGQRLSTLNTKLVKNHLETISYAGNALFPSYFSDGVKESLKPKLLTGGEPALVLRLPEYTERVYAILRNELVQSGSMMDSFKETLREYLCDSLIDASMYSENLTEKQAYTIGDPRCNTAIITAQPSTEKRINTLRALAILAFAKESFDLAMQYSLVAQEAAQEYPALLQQCILDHGDIIALTGNPLGRALEVYRLAFEGGRPGSSAQFSIWLEGLLRKLPHTLYVQGMVLTSDDVARENGMLPLLYASIFQTADIAFRVDKKALCEVRTEFVDGFRFPDCVQLTAAVQRFLASLPARGDKGLQLDAVYEMWFARLQKLEFEVRPPASTIII